MAQWVVVPIVDTRAMTAAVALRMTTTISLREVPVKPVKSLPPHQWRTTRTMHGRQRLVRLVNV